MPDDKIKISPAKGRPLLRWVGKKPLDYVKGFPAQLVEVFDPLNTGHEIETPTYDDLKDNWQNLLFHGDNKEVMATLIENGFRGKIDLIYIDPPFNTGVDYVRRVQLRGMRGQKLEGEGYALQEQVMYINSFAEDTYLQFMYERLQLLRELLAETGSIFVRIDYRFGHSVKLIMDEIFGKENFKNEIVIRKSDRPTEEIKKYHSAWDRLLYYVKSSGAYFCNVRAEREAPGWRAMHLPGVRWTLVDPQYVHMFSKENLLEKNGKYVSRARIILGKEMLPPEGRHWAASQEAIFQGERRGNIKLNPKGTPVALESETQKKDDIWTDIPGYSPQNTGYPTENARELLNRVIETGVRKHPNAREAIVFDCFIGSGTTAVVAQRFSSRWIGCDINKGAIQTTSKELQKIIHRQINESKGAKDAKLPRYYSFGIYQVNNYDLQLLKTEAIELAAQHIGIQRVRTDTFFDGYLGKSLVKIIDFNHPLTLLDLQLIQDELKKRPDEDRDIAVVCLGKELAVDPKIDEWNKKHPVNKIKLIELKTDKKYGNFLIHKPAEAKIAVQKLNENKALIEIQDFISPTIIERLNIDQSLFRVKIPDFRCMIDTVLIDSNYDGKTFHIVYSDVPERKTDLVVGKYEIEPPNPNAKIAVKIIDMLGEEILIESNAS